MSLKEVYGIKSLEDAFIYACRINNGSIEEAGRTIFCNVPQRKWIDVLREFKLKARTVEEKGEKVRFVINGETYFEISRLRTVVELYPITTKAFRVKISKKKVVADKLYKTFREERRENNSYVEGRYTINMDNEFALYGTISEPVIKLEELDYKVYQLASMIDTKMSYVAGVDDKSFKWFKERAKRATDWFTFIRG